MRAVTRPTTDALERLRQACLALPETSEKEAWGDPTFRVRDKIFAMMKFGDGRISMWCKAPPGVQEILVGAAPERFFVPPYVGHKGWIGVRLDVEVEWDEIAELAADSYRMTAPKRLVSVLDGGKEDACVNGPDQVRRAPRKGKA
jgi:hypothetical protein